MTLEDFEQWLEDRSEEALADLGGKTRTVTMWLSDYCKRLRSMAADDIEADNDDVSAIDELIADEEV